MKLISLYLKGFKGISRGLGRDEVTLSFEGLRGLIALAGVNGRSKTTILDNLHPYPIMPSRAGMGLEAKAFSYYDHLNGSSAEKKLVFEINGKRYLSHAKWNVAKRSAEWWLFVESDAKAWEPVMGRDGTQSDGRLDPYNRLVEEVCGPPSAFFTSVFSAQQRRFLSDYKVGEAKQWIASLMDHGPTRELCAKAKSIVKVLEAQCVALRTKLQGKAMIAARVTSLTLEIEKAASLIDTATAAHAEAKAKRDQAFAACEQWKAAASDRAQRARLRTEAEADHRRKQTALTEARSRLKSDEQAHGNAVRDWTQQLDQRVAHATTAQRNAETEQAALTTAITALPGLKAMSEAANLLQTSLAESQSQRRLIAEQVEELTELERNQAKAESGRTLQAAAHTGATARLQALVQQATLIDDVPCKGFDHHHDCKLLAQAHLAAKSKPAIEAELLDIATRLAGSDEELKRLTDAARALNDPRVRLKKLDAEITQSTQVLDGYRRELQRLPLAEQAESKLPAVTEKLDQAKREVQAATTDRANKLAALEATFASTRTAAENNIAALARDEQAAREAFERLPAEGDQESSALDANLRRAETELANKASDVERLKREQQNRREQRSAAETSLDTLVADERELERLDGRVSLWKMLVEALGDNGIIALDIDAAGPAIAAHANHILREGYGPRFAVEFRTQRQDSKGQLVEDFEIMVHDAISNECQPMSSASGGERVWLNEAVMRGVALYLQNQTQWPHKTLFSDETDGPLDPARKLAFIGSKRLALQLGDLDAEVFITQSPELRDLADHVIDLDQMAVQ